MDTLIENLDAEELKMKIAEMEMEIKMKQRRLRRYHELAKRKERTGTLEVDASAIIVEDDTVSEERVKDIHSATSSLPDEVMTDASLIKCSTSSSDTQLKTQTNTQTVCNKEQHNTLKTNKYQTVANLPKVDSETHGATNCTSDFTKLVAFDHDYSKVGPSSVIQNCSPEGLDHSRPTCKKETVDDVPVKDIQKEFSGDMKPKPPRVDRVVSPTFPPQNNSSMKINVNEKTLSVPCFEPPTGEGSKADSTDTRYSSHLTEQSTVDVFLPSCQDFVHLKTPLEEENCCISSEKTLGSAIYFPKLVKSELHVVPFSLPDDEFALLKLQVLRSGQPLTESLITHMKLINTQSHSQQTPNWEPCSAAMKKQTIPKELAERNCNMRHPSNEYNEDQQKNVSTTTTDNGKSNPCERIIGDRVIEKMDIECPWKRTAVIDNSQTDPVVCLHGFVVACSPSIEILIIAQKRLVTFWQCLFGKWEKAEEEFQVKDDITDKLAWISSSQRYGVVLFQPQNGDVNLTTCVWQRGHSRAHWFSIKDRLLIRDLLVCSVDGRSIVVARCCTETVKLLKLTLNSELLGIESEKMMTPTSKLHSLVAVQGLTSAVIGIGESKLLVWNHHNGHLIKSIEFHVFGNDIYYVSAEQGLLFMVASLLNDSDTMMALVAVNPVSTKHQILAKIAWKSILQNTRFLKMYRQQHFLIAYTDEEIFMWNILSAKMLVKIRGKDISTCNISTGQPESLYVGHINGKVDVYTKLSVTSNTR